MLNIDSFKMSFSVNDDYNKEPVIFSKKRFERKCEGLEMFQTIGIGGVKNFSKREGVKN